MFSTTSSAPLTRTARSTRQSGLKKPRPLRSVSLQEQPTDSEIKKFTPERQLSTPASNGVNGVCVGNDFPICEGISAMSALITAQVASDTDNSPADTAGKKENMPCFDRQDSNSSYNSYLDSESGSSFYSISRQNSLSTEISAAIHQQRESTPMSFRHQCNADASNVAPLDVNSNNVNLNGSYQDATSLCLSRNEDFSNVPLITLLTNQGEKLILTGKSMPTILNASKILVREMGASIISMRFEDLNDDSVRQQGTPTTTVSINPIQASTESPSPAPQVEDQNQKEKKVIRYSKDDLLAMSECDVARKPPANWNILIHTHSDCCLPADKMREYFEAIDFHAHDGTLVMEDRRLRDNRRDRDGREQIVY